MSDRDIDANTPDSRECKDSKVIYPSVGHVVNGNLKIIPDSNINSKGPKYKFRESVECNALKEWKLSIFNMLDKHIEFYLHNTNVLPPRPKSCFSLDI